MSTANMDFNATLALCARALSQPRRGNDLHTPGYQGNAYTAEKELRDLANKGKD